MDAQPTTTLPKALPRTLRTTLPWDDDKPHEECGVFGVWNAIDAAALTALGLHALQHRGQAATGIVSFDGRRFHSHKGLGLVGDNFGDARVIAALPGSSALGHNRYATTGETILRNVQPLYADFEFGGFAVAHNGNLTNAHALRRALVRRGCLFQSTTDSEVFIHLIAISLYSTVADRLIDALKQVVGAYSLVALSNEALMGVRDPLGVRPLILGRIDSAGGAPAWVLASETCALEIVGAEFVRDVEPGEIVVINDKGVHSIKPFGATRGRFCVFEYIYFARPDSVVEGTPVYEARKKIGAELARESHVPADVVVPVPDSRRARRDGLRRRERRAVRARHHPQPLCRPHLHRADRPDPPSRREAEALRQRRRAEGAARGAGGRQHRARHDQPEDRRDGARMPGRPRCTCASPRRRPPIPASTASTRPSAASCSPRATRRRRWRSRSAPTAWPSSRSTASTARSAMPGASRGGRGSATPASPASIRSRCPTCEDNADRQLSLLMESR